MELIDIVSQRPLLVPDNAKRPNWKEVFKIIEKDDATKLRQLLCDAGAGAHHEMLELVARPQESKDHKTALHAAVEIPAPECLKVLLESHPSLDVLDSPDNKGNTPLNAAVKSLNCDAITKLIKAGATVNVRNDYGNSPLHLLVYAAARGGELSSRRPLLRVEGNRAVRRSLLRAEGNQAVQGPLAAAPFIENFDKCVDALLECPSLDMDALNYNKFTPLRAAAEKMSSKTGSLKTFCQKLVQKGASIDEHTRQILVEHNVPISQDEATTLPLSQTATAKLLNLLVGDQSEGIADMFSGVSATQEVRAAANCYLGSKKVLHYLVDRCSETGVRALLLAGADPWSTSRKGELALHSALAHGDLAIANLLINEMKTKKNSNRIDLRHKSFSLLQKALENNIDIDKTATKCYNSNKYECLNRLFEDDVLIDVNQKDERPDINQTALHIAGAMNNQDAMTILLEHGAYLGERRMIGKQNMGTVLNALMAKTLEKTMDNCIKVQSQAVEQNGTLDPERKKRIIEEDTLNCNYTLELNCQFLMSPTPSEPTKVQQLENEVSLLYDVSQSQEHRNSIKHPLIQTFLYAKWRKVFPLYILNLFLYMMFVTPSEPTKVQQLENEVSLLYKVSQSHEHRNCIKHPLIQTLIYAKWEKTRVYVAMLRLVSWNFLKLILIFMLPIVAFSFGFFVTLQPDDDAQNKGHLDFWPTFVRTIVMSTGEFEFSSISEQLTKDGTFQNTSSVIMFLLFIFLVYLVLMNVMTGFAVNDVKEIKEDAEFYSLKSKIEFVYLNEQLFIKVPFLQRFLPRLQLFGNNQQLLVKINKLRNIKRIIHVSGQKQFTYYPGNRMAEVI
ncbi:CARD- and ANK-domain containing inflammasome adapter protein-like, partial [Hyalella azteca]|uniref:CARD- and ANK-domain containing inflammasome adapter protein-like n=1 Tax=Hyalella azteca TaxID=294128 RepID=A0A8B7NTI7_HYAAZ